MSIKVKKIIEYILELLCWYIFKDSYNKSRQERINKINDDYVEKIKTEMYKDE